MRQRALPCSPILMGAGDLVPLPVVSPRPAGTPCRGFAFIVFDMRGLVVASAAAVEEENHKAAADDHGKEDAEAHHQPAPCRHGHVAGRDPSVVADINRPSSSPTELRGKPDLASRYWITSQL
jgi:hypothetical protein